MTKKKEIEISEAKASEESGVSEARAEKKERKKLLAQKAPKSGTVTEQDHDEAIFSELEQKKKKKKRKLIITVSIIVGVLLIALIVGVVLLRRSVNRRFNSRVGDVVSYEATVGNISTTVSGYGSLSNYDVDEIKVPANVEIDDVKVSVNDAVKEGEVIATVDKASVMSAMATVQDELDDLDKDIDKASYTYNDCVIQSGVNGRVKKLYGNTGDDITKLMYENGALALISLDGYMAFDIETDKLSSGEKVKVLRDDEKRSAIDGTVEIASLGKATILVKDGYANFEEKLTAVDADGNELGSGNAYIHNQLKITGTQGTISFRNVGENSTVYAGTDLYYVTDVTLTGKYTELLKEREQKEEELNELIKIYQNNALTAPYDGRIAAINYDESTYVAGSETSVVNLSDDKKMSVTINVDEANILSLEIGQSASVSISSIGDDVFEGQLTEINKTATSSSGVTRYTATVTLDKTEQMIAGMTASVIIKIQGVDDAVIIPIEALHQTSTTSYVYTSYDEETGEFGGLKEVETGIQNSSYVEITSGLEKGDTVYYTETENSAFTSMMSGMPGGMPGGDFGGGNFGGGPGGGNFSGGPGGMR